MCSNIPSKPAYGVYISQLIRVGRICSTYKNRHCDLTANLIKQGFWYSRLCQVFRRFSRMHASMLSKFVCSVCKHIPEGILCLPALDEALGRHNYQEYMRIICTACTLSGMVYSRFASILISCWGCLLYFIFSKPLRLACTVLWYV